ncbi:MAG: HDOD domain-containing protein [Alkalispirochaetaceae bacterium]
MSKTIDFEKVRNAARKQEPYAVKTFTMPHETEVLLEQILEVFLLEMGQEELKDALAYCLRELAVNAKKANTKRVYFQEKGLSLENDGEYKIGMSNFKNETLDNIGHYLKKQKEAGLYIRVVYHVRGTDLHIYVVNNAPMTRKEQIRVFDRIARSRAFNSLEEALTTVLDDSEGAGLGIVILVLMLKKIGLDEDRFDIEVRNGETIAHLNVPMAAVKKESLKAISEKLAHEIDSLPKFPESVLSLQKMIEDPDSEITDIARAISTDPSLTAGLLKTVNSAQFMLPKRVDNIVEAVKLVGLRGLRNMLFSYGTREVLGDDSSDETKELWEHSRATGFYAYTLARNISKKKEILDDVYVGGVLHDMGKIVMSHVNPEMLDTIRTFCSTKDIAPEILEDLVSGVNHAEIGGLLAERWNFPEALVDAIRFHHAPTAAPEEYRDVAFTVYLANFLANHHTDDHVEFGDVDSDVLESFGITSAEQLNAIRDKLRAAYRAEFNSKNEQAASS